MKLKHKGYLLISDKVDKKPEITEEGQKILEEIKTDEKEKRKASKIQISFFLIKKKKKKPKEKYYEFCPLLLQIHEGKNFKELSSFNESVDIYFQKFRCKKRRKIRQRSYYLEKIQQY